MLGGYDQEVLSRFRGYDMVARYGNDAFAGPFPNTQREGVLDALEKTRQRARKTQINHVGKSLPFLSFSSVLTFYMPSKKPAACPKWADETLEGANARGPRQSVMGLPGR